MKADSDGKCPLMSAFDPKRTSEGSRLRTFGAILLGILIKGRVTAFWLIYAVAGVVQIVSVMLTNTHGELNAYGWVSGILGLLVGAPWTWAFLSNSFPSEYWRPLSIGAVALNAWLIYKCPYWMREEQFAQINEPHASSNNSASPKDSAL